MLGIIRLVVYTLLFGGILTVLGAYPETIARLQFQIVLFLAVGSYMLVLIRRGKRVNLGVVPEVLYLLASAYVVLVSTLRLSAFH
ncbi:hypothetical protein [Novosphingobium sp. PASSN1]|uniref:hypothetical protein n=1 Tax=Novosphingobium sp. PASSN1 TaxID=2015561 RepID=UPI000BC56287|nr:hypothetical protein [Novosphingobium sp. PASSN1]OYU35530.1 MAG: hypothetical protein CFE35_08395 [Novosphingobium sp. PASSN1]